MSQQLLRDVLMETTEGGLINPVRCSPWSSLFGALGTVFAVFFSVLGASYGTARSAPSIFQTGVLRPDRFMPNLIASILAQILAVYGLVTGVVITGRLSEKMPLHEGILQMGAGLAVGLCGLAAGLAIGVVGDAGIRGSTQQQRLYVGMVLILIFSEVLGWMALKMFSIFLSFCSIFLDCSIFHFLFSP